MKPFSAALVLAWAHAVCAQPAGPYPARAVRIVVGYPAGGSIDIVGRLVGTRLADALGQPVVVDNRAGAAGNIGTDHVARSVPDGCTLLMGSAASISSAPNMYAMLPYDPVRDLAAVILVANQPNVLIVHPSVPVRTVKAFVELARANPGKFNYGSSGIGATQHMTAELFAMVTGVKIVHVPYKGGVPAMADLLGGHIDFMFDTAPTAVQHVKSGRMRALAVTSLVRSAALPHLPTMDEAGLTGFELRGWIGLLGPAGLPRDVVGRLNGEVQRMLGADLRPRLVEMGLDVVGGSPEQFGTFIREDIAKYAKIVQAAGIARQ